MRADCFLRSDPFNSRLQTSSGSCTKRAGEVALCTNMAEGRERKGPSDPHGGYPVTPQAAGPRGAARVSGHGVDVGVTPA